MDVALLLLLPLVGGHVFATNWHCSRFRIARDAGQRLYFSAIFYGTFCFVCAILIRLWVLAHPRVANLVDDQVSKSALRFVLKAEPSTQGIDRSFTMIYVAILSFVIGLTAWFPLNVSGRAIWLVARFLPHKVLGRWRYSYYALRLPPMLWLAIHDDDISVILYMSILKPKPVAVTLDSRKVYIGYVHGSPDPCVERKALTLFPVLSGFRNSKTQELEVTTRYTRVYRDVETQDQAGPHHRLLDEFRVVIPLHKISSIGLFDIVQYARFLESRSQVPPASKDADNSHAGKRR